MPTTRLAAFGGCGWGDVHRLSGLWPHFVEAWVPFPAGDLKDQKCGQVRVFIAAVSCVSGVVAYPVL